MAAFTNLVDLAQERLGGSVVYANDEFFAPKDNLLKAAKPIFKEGEFTDRGKWMDGWETRRRRTPGHDFCIVRLGAPGIVRGVVIDTAHFKGNFPQHASIDACAMHGNPDIEQLLAPSMRWIEILPQVGLVGDAPNGFPIDSRYRVTHLRLHIYPDGGVARLRVHGDVLADPRLFTRGEVDLAAVENGASVVLCNDMFFGSRLNLTMPGFAANMGDGWETKRSRSAGPDWAIVRLATAGTIERIEVDTAHFKGNAPESCAIQVAYAPTASDATAGEITEWHDLLRRTKLQPHTRHLFEREIVAHAQVTHARLQIFPDGGVSRLRLFGRASQDGRERAGLARLNALFQLDLLRELRGCCASDAWALGVGEQRPYASMAQLVACADRVWSTLPREAWREAFRGHPRIGERAPSNAPESARRWSEEEQSSVSKSGLELRVAIDRRNRDYEAKFGHIFLICATGKRADQVLSALDERMSNDADTELQIAAEEHRKIVHLRLAKLVSG